MELVLKRGHDAKVPATTPHAPEEVGVLSGAGGKALAVRRNEIDGAEVIGGQAVGAGEPAIAAPQGEPRDPRRGEETHRGGQPKDLRLAVKLAQGEAGLSVGRALHQIDAQALHAGEVDHEAAVADRVAGDAVATAAHGDKQVMLACKPDALDDVRSAGAAHDK